MFKRLLVEVHVFANRVLRVRDSIPSAPFDVIPAGGKNGPRFSSEIYALSHKHQDLQKSHVCEMPSECLQLTEAWHDHKKPALRAPFLQVTGDLKLRCVVTERMTKNKRDGCPSILT